MVEISFFVRARCYSIFFLDETTKRYSNALIYYLGSTLYFNFDTLSEAYDSGAVNMAEALMAYVSYDKPNPSVVVLNDTEGRIVFLYPEIDWMKYYNTCKPSYCEVTIQMDLLNKGFRAAGLLGVMTIILGIVNIILWPAVAFLLRWYYKNSEKDERSRILPAGVRSHDLEKSMSSSSGILPLPALSSHDHEGITSFIGPEHMLAQRTMLKAVEEVEVNRLRSRGREK